MLFNDMAHVVEHLDKALAAVRTFVLGLVFCHALVAEVCLQLRVVLWAKILDSAVNDSCAKFHV